MKCVETIGLILLLVSLPSIAHEIPDPTVTLTGENLDLGAVKRALWEQTGFQISSGPTLSGQTVSVSAVDTPVSDVFGRLRREYQICAYIPSLNVPGTFIQLTNCVEPHRDCTYGLAEPYPRPKHPINLCGSPDLPRELAALNSLDAEQDWVVYADHQRSVDATLEKRQQQKQLEN